MRSTSLAVRAVNLGVRAKRAAFSFDSSTRRRRTDGPPLRFADRDRFVQDLKQLGFDQFAVEDRWKFSYIRALKAKRVPNPEVTLSF